MKTLILIIWLHQPGVINVGPVSPEKVIVASAQEAAIIMWEKKRTVGMFGNSYSAELVSVDLENGDCEKVEIPEVKFTPQ